MRNPAQLQTMHQELPAAVLFLALAAAVAITDTHHRMKK